MSITIFLKMSADNMLKPLPPPDESPLKKPKMNEADETPVTEEAAA